LALVLTKGFVSGGGGRLTLQNRCSHAFLVHSRGLSDYDPSYSQRLSLRHGAASAKYPAGVCTPGYQTKSRRDKEMRKNLRFGLRTTKNYC
jgi:hypothetical protein